MPLAASAETVASSLALPADAEVGSASEPADDAEGRAPAVSPVAGAVESVPEEALVSCRVAPAAKVGEVGSTEGAGAACATAIRAATVSPTAARRRNPSRRWASRIDSETVRYPATSGEATAAGHEVMGRVPSLATAQRPRGRGSGHQGRQPSSVGIPHPWGDGAPPSDYRRSSHAASARSGTGRQEACSVALTWGCVPVHVVSRVAAGLRAAG